MPPSIPHINQDIAILSATKLRRRYIVALSFIAFLIITSQIIIQSLLADQIHDSHIVNIAGRQRMLSQKITKLSYYISNSETNEIASQYRLKLHDAVLLWEKSHFGLIHGNPKLELPGENSQLIHNLFEKIQPHHSAILQAAKKIITTDNATETFLNTQIISQHEDYFLKGMDKIVFQYDKEANAKVAHAKWLEIALMIFTLSVLVLEAFFIFAPATRSLQQSMRILSRREQDLQNLFAASPTAMLLIEPTNFVIIQANQKAQTLIGEPVSTATLQHYLDADYKSNERFINKLKKGTSLNEDEIVILNAQGTPFETLVSVRIVTFDGKAVLVIGITNISELKKAQKKLEHYASFDEMTGLLNRRTGLVLLRKSMQQVKQTIGQLSICYIDLDGLKMTNDNFGHSEGDWLIRTVSHLLTDTIRDSDAAVRLGGDEFLLIFHDCSCEDTEHIIITIKAVIKNIEALHNKPFPIRFSYGIVTYTGERNITPDELISESDNLMYQSKYQKKLKLAQLPKFNH